MATRFIAISCQDTLTAVRRALDGLVFGNVRDVTPIPDNTPTPPKDEYHLATSASFGVSALATVKGTGEGASGTEVSLEVGLGRGAQLARSLCVLAVLICVALLVFVHLKLMLMGTRFSLVSPDPDMSRSLLFRVRIQLLAVAYGLTVAAVVSVTLTLVRRWAETHLWRVIDPESKGLLLSGTFAPDDRAPTLALVPLAILAFVLWRVFGMLGAAAVVLVPSLLSTYGTRLFSHHADLYRRANLLNLTWMPLQSATCGLALTGVLFPLLFGLVWFVGVDSAAMIGAAGPLLLHSPDTAVAAFTHLPDASLPSPDRWLPHLSADPTFYGLSEPVTDRSIARIALQWADVHERPMLVWLLCLSIVGTFTVVWGVQLIMALWELRRGHRRVARRYRSPELPGATVRYLDERNPNRVDRMALWVWSLAMWALYTAGVSFAAMLAYQALAVALDLRLLPGWEWLAPPYYFLWESAHRLSGEWGWALYGVLCVVGLGPALLLWLLYKRSGSASRRASRRIFLDPGHVPTGEQRETWHRFLDHYDLPGIDLRVCSAGGPKAIWYGNRPCVVLPPTYLHKPYFGHHAFTALHEIGHLFHWLPDIWESVSTGSFTGPGVLAILADPWCVERNPDRFALSRIRRYDPAQYKRALQHLRRSRRQMGEGSSPQCQCRPWRTHALGSPLLSYLHAPGEKRALDADRGDPEFATREQVAAALRKRRWVLGLVRPAGYLFSIMVLLLTWRAFAQTQPKQVRLPQTSAHLGVRWESCSRPEDGQLAAIDIWQGQFVLGTTAGLWRWSPPEDGWERAMWAEGGGVPSTSCLAVDGQQLFFASSRRQSGQPALRVYQLKDGIARWNALVPPGLHGGSLGGPLQILPAGRRGFLVSNWEGILGVRPLLRHWVWSGNPNRDQRTPGQVLWREGGDICWAYRDTGSPWKTIRCQGTLWYCRPEEAVSGEAGWPETVLCDNRQKLWMLWELDGGKYRVTNARGWLEVTFESKSWVSDIDVSVSDDCLRGAVAVAGEDGLRIWVVSAEDVVPLRLPKELREATSRPLVAVGPDSLVMLYTEDTGLWLCKDGKWRALAFRGDR